MIPSLQKNLHTANDHLFSFCNSFLKTMKFTDVIQENLMNFKQANILYLAASRSYPFLFSRESKSFMLTMLIMNQVLVEGIKTFSII